MIRVFSYKYSFQPRCSHLFSNKKEHLFKLPTFSNISKTPVSIKFFSIMSKYIFPPKEVREEAIKNAKPKSDFPPIDNSKIKAKGRLNLLENSIKTPDDVALFGDISKTLPLKQPKNAKILRVALIGTPNAGKSTLVNSLVNNKVSIVSNKSQTTRELVIGVSTINNIQLIFLDTPGVISSKNSSQIQRTIVKTAWDTIEESDLNLLLIDLTFTISSEIKELLNNLRKLKESNKIKNIVLILNKSDAVKNTDKILKNPFMHPFLQNNFFKEIFVISALKKQGTLDLRDYLLLNSVPGDWEYSQATVSPMSDVDFLFEVIREKIYQQFHYEIPYLVSQENLGWTELTDGTLRIDQYIFVEKESQQRMLIGKNGKLIENVVKAAKMDLSERFKKPVELYISVKVKKSVSE